MSNIQELDRMTAPEFIAVKSVDLIQAVKTNLNNGINVYTVSGGAQDLIRLEIIFSAGTYNQSKPLIAQAAMRLMKEGTIKHNSNFIANHLDYYGAFLELDAQRDNSVITLYVLNKHLENVLPIINSIISEPIFALPEFDLYKTNQKQSFLVNSKKVDFIARQKFNEILFGPDHPYGKNANFEDYDNLNLDDVKLFYQNNFKQKPYFVISGNVDYQVEKLIKLNFENLKFEDKLQNEIFSNEYVAANKNQLIEMPDAVQSAIRIGRKIVGKGHPDYHGLQVLNCILGGYFGSRLMNNIREDKGYTYGIGSGLLPLKFESVFVISTEVGVDVCTAALKEIYFEIEKLQTELVGADELEIVKNYMLGVFLRNTDGTFALADRFKGIFEFDLSYSYYDDFVATVNSITAEEIKMLAIKYLAKEDLTELVVGKK